MIGPHLAQLRQALETSDQLPAATKAELLRLVHAAESEAAGETVQSDAEEAAGDGEGSVLDQLRQSLEELESAHPEAAAAVTRVANVLGNMGI